MHHYAFTCGLNALIDWLIDFFPSNFLFSKLQNINVSESQRLFFILSICISNWKWLNLSQTIKYSTHFDGWVNLARMILSFNRKCFDVVQIQIKMSLVFFYFITLINYFYWIKDYFIVFNDFSLPVFVCMRENETASLLSHKSCKVKNVLSETWMTFLFLLPIIN